MRRNIDFVIRALLAFIVIAGLTSDLWAEEGFYLAGELLAHSKQHDCPEYCGNNPLIGPAAGYTFKLAHSLYIDGELGHMSSVPDKEHGDGFNYGKVRVRWYPFK